MSIVRPLALLGFAALLAAPAAAAQHTADELLERCRSEQHRSDLERHCEVRESRLPAGSLRLDAAPAGGVSIRSHAGSGVVVRAVVHAHAEDAGRARELARQVRIHTDGTVRATGPDATGNEGWHVSYDVLVPARTDLEVEATNGPLSVTGVDGVLRLRTRNGPVRLDGVSGDVHASAQNGPVNVTLAGDRWRGRGLVAETVNGPVTVRMPASYAARVQGSTRHGPIVTDLPVSGSGRGGGTRTIDTEVNGGGPTLRFTTVNGPLTIRRS